MQHVLQTAPFPSLTWDEYWWSGLMQLQAWTGYETWYGPDGQRSVHGSPDGTTEVRVWPHDDDPEQPTLAQAAAYRYLLAHQEEIRDAMLAALVYKYPDWQAWCAPREARQASVLAAPVQMKRLLGLTGVNIFTTEKNGLAYVGYELSCAWQEHALGVMTHAGHVVLVDGADTAIQEAVAERDRAGQPLSG